VLCCAVLCCAVLGWDVLCCAVLCCAVLRVTMGSEVEAARGRARAHVAAADGAHEAQQHQL
jgi:hypothetical protein